jgi:predicted nucleic acid-binding protein
LAIVVSDTSPVRALTQLDLLYLLERLFGQVLIPPAVASELLTPRRAGHAVDVTVIPYLRVQAPKNIARVEQLQQELDLGESEAIALALEVGAAAVLIDEFDGREAARREGLAPVGALGVLLRAKDAGLIPLVRPSIDLLQTQFKFFLSTQVHEEVLRLAGEL